jgi:hypothetical protein
MIERYEFESKFEKLRMFFSGRELFKLFNTSGKFQNLKNKIFSYQNIFSMFTPYDRNKIWK